MPISILSNVASLRAQRQLTATSGELERTYERLSSGLRINHASDDAAGLSISTALKSDARLTSVAIRNANDGVSLIAIGDAAFGEITNVLVRMAELAEQSANGVYTQSQRSPLEAEFAALGSEIERIAVTTTFNGIHLLSGVANIVLQVGITALESSRITVRGTEGTLQGIHLAAGGTSSLTYSIIANTNVESQAAARTALEAVYAAIQEVGVKRGTLGATENRLHASISNLTSTRQTLETASSRIQDVDVAEEVSKLVRLQILQQASAAILAQANLQPQLALRLLT